MSKAIAEMVGAMLSKLMPPEIAEQLTLENLEKVKSTAQETVQNLNDALLILNAKSDKIIENQVLILFNLQTIAERLDHDNRVDIGDPEPLALTDGTGSNGGRRKRT